VSSHLRKNPKDDNELGASQLVIIFCIEGKNQEMMMSREACCCLLHLRKKLRNDDEPLGSLSSVTLQKKTKEMMTS